jgi:ribosomal protein L10
VRTTLSLDEDVAKQLRREIRRSGASLKVAVNHFLRLGLMVSGKKSDRKPFLVHPRPLGLPPGLSYDNVEDLIEAIEGTTHK